jgi:4-alpha-glucanotransferase
MLNFRASGILLHPTSFPSRFGIGDLGQAAYDFMDFLARAGQKVWQILPIGPTGFANSPYLSYSALAGNPLLISPEKLVEEGLLSEQDFSNLPHFHLDFIDYDLVIEYKMPLLQKAYENFQKKTTKTQKEAYEKFCREHSHWLDDYALFMALKEAQKGLSWYEWDRSIAFREPKTLATWTKKLASEIAYHKFLQFEFFRQWKALKKYANDKGVQIFGDIPIYVAHDSVDVWANPQFFCIDQKTGAASLMAGVPPDYFSETGQLWGNPVYNWDELKKTDFEWWVQRIKGMLEYVDLMRIDHFRGFEAYWAVPQGEKTAMNGKWLKAPGIHLFEVIERKLGKLPIIAEDLGVITHEVEELRDRNGFPGMKVLHFAFDSGSDNPFLPFNYRNSNCVVYTGTHDNDTTVGWFNKRNHDEQQKVTEYLGCVCDNGIHWTLIRVALNSCADLAIFPFQDPLGLGTECRMNTPGVAEGNWAWRYRQEAANDGLADYIKHLTNLYGR